jgi:hypothetical protein
LSDQLGSYRFYSPTHTIARELDRHIEASKEQRAKFPDWNEHVDRKAHATAYARWAAEGRIGKPPNLMDFFDQQEYDQAMGRFEGDRQLVNPEARGVNAYMGFFLKALSALDAQESMTLDFAEYDRTHFCKGQKGINSERYRARTVAEYKADFLRAFKETKVDIGRTLQLYSRGDEESIYQANLLALPAFVKLAEEGYRRADIVDLPYADMHVGELGLQVNADERARLEAQENPEVEMYGIKFMGKEALRLKNNLLERKKSFIEREENLRPSIVKSGKVAWLWQNGGYVPVDEGMVYSRYANRGNLKKEGYPLQSVVRQWHYTTKVEMPTKLINAHDDMYILVEFIHNFCATIPGVRRRELPVGDNSVISAAHALPEQLRGRTYKQYYEDYDNAFKATGTDQAEVAKMIKGMQGHTTEQFMPIALKLLPPFIELMKKGYPINFLTS